MILYKVIVSCDLVGKWKVTVQHISQITVMLNEPSSRRAYTHTWDGRRCQGDDPCCCDFFLSNWVPIAFAELPECVFLIIVL